MPLRSAMSQESDEKLSLEDTREAAEAAGLRYVSDEETGFTRKRSGRGFAYYDTQGKLIRDEKILKRVRSLAVPPAYTDVWICRDARGHIQATGRDDKGRKQYRYHAKWSEVRDSVKYEHMIEFAEALPLIREKIDEHMRLRNLSRNKVLAVVVHLLETTLIRIGNEDYVKANKSFGLTTLRNQHVQVDGGELKFEFKGKSGKSWKLKLRDRRVAKVVKQCQDLPGQHLFAYVDDDGERRVVTSSDVNEYLREISGAQITAKDFRTWAGTVLAAMALAEFEAVDSAALAKKNIKQAIERVAQRLGNTPTICRKCYVHPQVVQSYLDGELAREVREEIDQELREDISHLEPEEAALLALLRKRLGKVEAKAA
jgi:DNA topoisomerase-1